MSKKQGEPFDVELNMDNTFICGTTDSMKTVAVRELAKLEAQNQTIYVTDPYLFYAPDTSYECDLTEILKGLKAKEIQYCVKTVRGKDFFNRIVQELAQQNCTLKHVPLLKDYHDRFWLCNASQKAVVFGTSLNGLCKRICRVDMLNSEEILELKKALQNEGVNI